MTKQPGQAAYETFVSTGIDPQAYVAWGDLHADTKARWAAVETAVRAAPSPHAPRFRHKIRGTTYTVLGDALLQNTYAVATDKTECTVYRGDDGKLWVRPTIEFYDGRFELIEGGRS